MHVCSVEIADTRTRGARDDDRQNQLKVLKPRQETDVYVSLEMGIGRPTASREAIRAAGPKIQTKRVRNGRPQTGVLAARLTARAACFARIRH